MPLHPLSPLASALLSLTAIAGLLCVFVMLGSRWLDKYLYAFAAESWAIAALAAVIAVSRNNDPELYLIAALTALFRGLALPYLIWRMIRRLAVTRELHEILRPASGLVIGAAAVVFALAVSYRLRDSLNLGDAVVILALTVMIAIQLIGFLMLAVRQEAVTQVIGLLVLENGILVGALILVPGMPLLIELMLLFDVLIAVACFGVLVRYLTIHVGTTSTLALKRLVG
jgi:hydrogenase-4 component E